MEAVFLKLAEAAVSGSWPAAFSIAFLAIAVAACVWAIAWAVTRPY